MHHEFLLWQIAFNMCGHQYSEQEFFGEQSTESAIQELNNLSQSSKATCSIIKTRPNYGTHYRGQGYNFHMQNSDRILFKCPICFPFPLVVIAGHPRALSFNDAMKPDYSYSDLFFTVSFEPSPWDLTKGELTLLLRATQRNEFYCAWNRLLPLKRLSIMMSSVGMSTR